MENLSGVAGQLKKELARAQQEVQRFSAALAALGSKTQRASYIVCVGSKADQLSAKEAMGADSESLKASEDSDGFVWQSDNVDFSPQEDCDGTAGAVGKVQSGEEEGGVELRTREENSDSSHLQTEEEVHAACNRGGKTRP